MMRHHGWCFKCLSYAGVTAVALVLWYGPGHSVMAGPGSALDPASTDKRATEAALKPLIAQGYAVVTTAGGDFDGDGLREVAASIADAIMFGGAEHEFVLRSEAGTALAARVVVLKPGAPVGKPWQELPLTGGTGVAAAYASALCAVNLVADGRPELFVRTYQPFMGNTGEGDAYVYTYDYGRFQEIWRVEEQSWRWAVVAYCEIARLCRGRELIVVHAPEDPYHMWNNAQRFPLSTYGYRGGKFELLSKRLTIGRYHSAEEVLGHLSPKGHWLLP